MKTMSKFFIVLSVLALTACGSSSTRDFTTNSQGFNNNNTNNNNSGGGTGNINNLPLAPEFDAHISGMTGVQPSASYTTGTSNLLRIKVTPLAAPNLIIAPYTNWVFPYGCLTVQVHVNGITRTTQYLRVAGTYQAPGSPCADAPDHQILDFTGSSFGSGNITVTIDNPTYDNCRNWWPLNYGSQSTYNCNMSAVWKNHMVAATIAVQTDGTYLSE